MARNIMRLVIGFIFLLVVAPLAYAARIANALDPNTPFVWLLLAIAATSALNGILFIYLALPLRQADNRLTQ